MPTTPLPHWLGCYKNVKDNTGQLAAKPLDAIAEEIRSGSQSGRLVKVLQDLLATGQTDAYAERKKNLPAFTAAGIFEPTRLDDNLIAHSGLVTIEVDHLKDQGAPDPGVVRDLMFSHVAARLAFVTPSGDGAKVLVEVNPAPRNKDEHKAAWAAASDSVAQLIAAAGFSLSQDPSVKNVSRLTFFGHDPEAKHRPEATAPVTWEMPQEPPVAAQVRNQPASVPPHESLDDDPPWAGTPYPFDDAPAEPSPELTRALDFLASKNAGEDDNHLLAVGTCLKALGHSFDFFDSWAERAGCTCADRKSRWESFNGADPDYSAIIGLAVNQGMGAGRPNPNPVDLRRLAQGLKNNADLMKRVGLYKYPKLPQPAFSISPCPSCGGPRLDVTVSKTGYLQTYCESSPANFRCNEPSKEKPDFTTAEGRRAWRKWRPGKKEKVQGLLREAGRYSDAAWLAVQPRTPGTPGHLTSKESDDAFRIRGVVSRHVPRGMGRRPSGRRPTPTCEKADFR